MDSCQGTKVGAGVTCPSCHGWKETREVPMEKGYNQTLRHFVCDHCEIGWYELPRSRQKRLTGGMEAAKRAYVAEGRPEKKKKIRRH
jgi:hypothetical protein